MGKRSSKPTFMEEALWAACEDRVVGHLWNLSPMIAAVIAIHAVNNVMLECEEELGLMKATGSDDLVFRFADNEKRWIKKQLASMPSRETNWDSATAEEVEKLLNNFSKDEQIHIALRVARWAVQRWERAELIGVRS